MATPFGGLSQIAFIKIHAVSTPLIDVNSNQTSDIAAKTTETTLDGVSQVAAAVDQSLAGNNDEGQATVGDEQLKSFRPIKALKLLKLAAQTGLRLHRKSYS